MEELQSGVVRALLAASQASTQIPALSHDDLTIVERVHSARAALSALDAAASNSPTECPASSDVVIIGAGLTGLILAASLVDAGAELLILEAQASVGGVWRWYGNPHSRVNSTEPAYRMKVKRAHDNHNHSHYFEVRKARD